jgi:hypothetical protein
MAKEDYEIEYKGEIINVSKAAKLRKLDYGILNFNNLKKRFSMIDFIENKNNIIKFSIYGKIYYYGLVANKVRREGSREWFGKVIKNIQKDIDDMFNNIEYDS